MGKKILKKKKKNWKIIELIKLFCLFGVSVSKSHQCRMGRMQYSLRHKNRIVRKQFLLSSFHIPFFNQYLSIGFRYGLIRCFMNEFPKAMFMKVTCGEKKKMIGDIHFKTLFHVQAPFLMAPPICFLLKTLFSWIYVSITSKTERVVTSFKSNLQNEKKYIFRGIKEKKRPFTHFSIFLQIEENLVTEQRAVKRI